MTDSISIYEQYNIDLNRLSRDYLKFPLKRQLNIKYHPLEIPPKEDIEYLYLELNLAIYEICEYFNIGNLSVIKWIKLYNLKKPKEQVNKCIEKTIIRKYGRTNYFKGKEGKEAVQNANIKKYGVSNAMQVKEIKQKAINTYKNKTGYDNPSQNPEVKKKKEETSLKNFGVKYHTQTEEFKNFIREHMSKHRNETNYVRSISKPERQWLDLLNIIDDQYHRQVLFMTTNYTNWVDGYDPETNTVYEFLGDYWHGNPKVYNLNKVNTQDSKKRTFKELNEYTFKRFDEIKKEFNVNIIYIWENDFIKYGKIKEDWKEKMVEY